MKFNQAVQFLEQKTEGQGFAGVVVSVFVTVLIGAVLLAPVQTSINAAKIAGGSAFNTSSSLNQTIDNLPLLFAVLLLVAVLASMIAIIS